MASNRSLRPIKTPPKVQDFLVYDLEWYPDTQRLRCVGVYDGVRFRWYRTIRAFLENELVGENAGKRFYAHAGGSFDIAYVLERVTMSTRWHVEASFSASSAVVVSVTNGAGTFKFCDSYFMLRSSLRKIARFLGVEKGGSEDTLAHFFAPERELVSYNEKDCWILWHALKQTQLGLLDIGAEMKVTAASTAMHFFRSRFLKTEIPTSAVVNRSSRESYCASRVEVRRSHASDVWCYDINSSFPHAMTFPCPGKVIGCDIYPERLPKAGTLYLALCKVTVPETDLPPTPYRHNGRVYFPTGSWGPVWLNSVDLELLQETGGTVDEIDRVYTFESHEYLADYARLLYEMRASETDEFRRELLKILMNSLYGKFAESEEKTALLVHPKKTTCRHSPPCQVIDPDTGEIVNDACLELLFPGAFLETKSRPIPHVHVPISSHLTAVARRTLYRYLAQCPDWAYCDTDSVFTGQTLPTGPGLGQLKLDPPERFESIRFIAPKVYGGRFESGKTKVRGKGFPGLDDEIFDLLQQGYAVGFRSMLRVRSLYRSGDLTPREETRLKGLVGAVRPKRRMLDDGSSVPWNVAEVQADRPWQGDREPAREDGLDESESDD